MREKNLREIGMHSAVLFLVFNRPDTTRQVFEAIRTARPKRLYIAADGPRHHKPTDKERCEEVRRILSGVDWPCDVKTLFREGNLGCTSAVSSGIDWFFDHEEEGIILEDDCSPNQDFFRFAEAMLQRYRQDARVMHISGANLQEDKTSPEASYYFSSMPVIWGWATWRRAWRLYDVDLRDLEDFENRSKSSSHFLSREERRSLLFRFDLVKHAKHTWDWQWVYCIKKNQGLCVTPRVNLVSNIGVGHADATATVEVNANADLPVHEIGEITHPSAMEIDITADKNFISEQYPYTAKMRLAYLLSNLTGIRPGLIFHHARNVYKYWFHQN